MERHDYDLKKLEDKLIYVTSEEAYCSDFHLNLKFEYKGKHYEATAYYTNGYRIEDIDIWHKGFEVVDQSMYDELYPQVRAHADGMKINEKNIVW
tara:strand:- start:42 stop:326 length:285 start_codon:yes stop_codon:yes gene_type:complete